MTSAADGTADGESTRSALGHVLRRLELYARATGVKFDRVPRRRGWSALGLPDTRGFTPHLRRVRVHADDADSFPRAVDVAAGKVGFDDLTVDELWLLHDLAHVVWYDFASATFGVERWRERDFFVEQHLASEAFAVLLLDYHVLSRTRHHGLAVELDADRWTELRTRVRELPELDGVVLCRELVELYLGGEHTLFQRELEASSSRRAASAALAADDAATIAKWRDHEVSYSNKQRWYVLLWWADLLGEPLGNEQAVVEGSTVAEQIWIALQLFTADARAPNATAATTADSMFAAHVERIAKRTRSMKNRFSELPKPRVARDRFDFRFTDVVALEPEAIAATLRRADVPRAENLFLLWQLLSLSTPDRLTTGERNAVVTLAKSVQTPSPDVAAWKVVRGICERIVVEERWTSDPFGRAAFFLP